MFQLQHLGNDRWQVLATGTPVFGGTMRRVEDWLDQQENVNRRRSLQQQSGNRLLMVIRRVGEWALDHLWRQPRPGTT